MKAIVLLALVLGACRASEPDSTRDTFCASTSDALGRSGARGALVNAIKALEFDPIFCAGYRQSIRDARMVITGFNRGTAAFERPYVKQVFDAMWIDHGKYISSVRQELHDLEDRCDERLEETPAATRRALTTALQTVISRLDAAMATCPFP